MTKDVFVDTKWEYGTFDSGANVARRDPETGCVQFIQWEAGHNGHTEDYWFALTPSWWSTFVPDGEK